MLNDSAYNIVTIPMIDIDTSNGFGTREVDGRKTEENNENLNAASNFQTERLTDGDNQLSDNVDAARVDSPTVKRDFYYFSQHPYLRLFIAYFSVICKFIIYAEDPVGHSVKECRILVIGNAFAFVFTKYPANEWSLLKVGLWPFAVLLGILIGTNLIHLVFFNRVFRLKMFSDDQGSWMTAFMTTLLTLYFMSGIFNFFLAFNREVTEPYRISDSLGLRNSIFIKAAAVVTWCGGFFTAWVVTDVMLQDKRYPNWAVGARAWWEIGYNRIKLFWIMAFISTFAVMFVIATDYIAWNKLNRGFLLDNEVSRSCLATCIVIMNVIIVMQDWDFPDFLTAFDIKLPGTNITRMQFPFPSFLRKYSSYEPNSGKWFKYSIHFILIILDVQMWKTQLLYAPHKYGQYIGPDGRIHSVLSTEQLDMFNETFLTYDFRNRTINPLTNQTYIHDDTILHNVYEHSTSETRFLIFIPGALAFLFLSVLIWKCGRYARPTEVNPLLIAFGSFRKTLPCKCCR